MGLSDPPVSPGAEILRADGYRFVVQVEPAAADFDAQGHLNNAATVRLFNDLRVAFVQGEVGADWVEVLRHDEIVVAAREVHVLYESQGLPGEGFVGALRYLRREGKAAVIEERLVEASTGRAVARAWVVQLLVQHGKVIDWPEAYFVRVAAIQGCEIPVRPRRPSEVWGPPVV